ncbi:hypothetical protein FHR84_000248 [Actinopolyspora biskrensis]|uniref:Uncharacterized protein n=1 Tax=Actinopolyspora biskrensis TaxID=1470178 RepID=A0A852YNS4_9ACTN|nr:hypothetical protein [Actinopolyspora biskrensis]NYH76934.1 hypothetical protein [Actinopolyspora biskrensis]
MATGEHVLGASGPSRSGPNWIVEEEASGPETGDGGHVSVIS